MGFLWEKAVRRGELLFNVHALKSIQDFLETPLPLLFQPFTDR
jgi:hypothetical protein